MAQDNSPTVFHRAIFEFTSQIFSFMLFHPFYYAGVLTQLGHEPLPPTPGTTFFTRQPVLYYPNLFSYMGHIRDVDGFFGLYRGMWLSLVHNVAFGITYEMLLEAADLPESADALEDLAVFLDRLKSGILCRALSVLITHPLRVETVRCMAQFVGREERYGGLISGLFQVYMDGGILGFFDGVVPRLLGDIFVILFANTVTYGMEKLVLKHRRYRGLIFVICTLVALSMTYSLRVVSTTIMVSGCGLAAGKEPNMPVYDNWMSCYLDLRDKGELGRGGKLWRRVANKK